jgi:hypothetical protein
MTDLERKAPFMPWLPDGVSFDQHQADESVAFNLSNGLFDPYDAVRVGSTHPSWGEAPQWAGAWTNYEVGAHTDPPNPDQAIYGAITIMVSGQSPYPDPSAQSNAPPVPTIRKTVGIVDRVEANGFGVIHEVDTLKPGFFTNDTLLEARVGAIRPGSRISVGVEDKNDLMVVKLIGLA